MRRLIWVGLVCLLMPRVEAACISLNNRPAWTQDQKNRTAAVAYRLLFEAGEDIVPTLTENTLCFAGSTLILASIVNETAILNRIAQDDIANAANTSAALARQQTFTNEIVGTTGNDLCNAELVDIVAKIQTIHDNRLTSINSSTTTFKANVDAAAGTVAAMKVQLKDLADRTATGFTMVYDDLQSLSVKLGKCIRSANSGACLRGTLCQ